MSSPVLVTNKLTVRFGAVCAVNNVDFTLDEGELRCLIGPNGAGKSTFFKAILGHVKPSSGQASFRGHDLSRLQPHAIARIGFGIKTQVPSLFDGLTAQENVWIAASRIHRGRDINRAVEALMERLQISDLRARRVNEMAHGERQLVELAMVLAPSPSLILLDEPAAGMTDRETERLARIIRDIQAKHSIIVVEHDMAFVRSIASKVTVLNQGAILVEGSVEEVLADQRVRDVYLGKKVPA